MSDRLNKVHIDRALTDISIAYKNEQFIGDQIFKPVVVSKQSDKYWVYGFEHFRINNDLRRPGTEANEIEWTLSTDSFYCDGHALRHVIPDEELANADSDVVDLRAEGTELVTNGILLNKEYEAATLVTSTSSYASGHYADLGTDPGTYKWSDYTNSNPAKDVQKAKGIIHKAIGLRANTLVLSEDVLSVLRFHPKLVAMLGDTEREVLTLDIIKALLNVDTILVGSALYNKEKEDTAGTVDLDYIWGLDAALLYVPPKPARRTPAFGYSFMWNGPDGDGPVGVRKWYENGKHGEVIEAERYYDQKIICNQAGFLFKNAVTMADAGL